LFRMYVCMRLLVCQEAFMYVEEKADSCPEKKNHVEHPL
jgi:hypothetical protein